MSKEAKSILSNMLYIAGVLFLSFLIVRYVGQRTEVIGNSMVPTLQDEDQLITDKITYRFRDPERFDIIVFPHEPVNEFYIKRIIGMPGETVEIRDGQLLIDGSPLEGEAGNTYGKASIAGLAERPVLLGENEYFVLGDNREVSEDSRFETVGNVPLKNMTGRGWFRTAPFEQIGLVR